MTHPSMFDGVQDHFHQFIAARSPLPLPLSFPLHHEGATASAAATPIQSYPAGCFDPYTHQSIAAPPHNHQHSELQQLHQQSSANKNEEKVEASTSSLISTNSVLERARSVTNPIDPWSNDEVLALLRIRSSLENWFPEFTWEHVSRKLGELGFHRTAEKCKEKFEEESRQFNNMSYSKNYRFFSELDELYHGENPQVSAEKNQNLESPKDKDEEEKKNCTLKEEAGNAAVANPSQENQEIGKQPAQSKKRKRRDEFEMFKGFCEAVVKKMIDQQEELHNRLIEDVLRREAESMAREEAWRSQELGRVKKEVEMRTKEKAIAVERLTKMIDCLKKFITLDCSEDQALIRRIEDLLKATNSSTSATSSCENLPHNINNAARHRPSGQSKLVEGATSSNEVVPHQIPTSLFTQTNSSLPTSSSETPSPHNHTSTPAADVPKPVTSSSMASQNPNDATYKVVQDKLPLELTPSSTAGPQFSQQMDSAANERAERDIGKRWPRDEVLALINLRCNLNNNSADHDKEPKGPLWERISQGMLELGYKRSAKRCKEKWENINKYFRKTKDSNKKRSLDSRTCPYFHQLNSLYSQGTIVAPSEEPENL